MEADIPREDKAAAGTETAVDHEKHELHETGASIGPFVCLVCFVVEIQAAFFAFSQRCLIKWQPALHSRYMNSLNPTSLRLVPADKRLLTRAARRRGMSLQKYLVDAGKKAATAPVSNLGLELEKLAIDGMAQLALVRIRARQSNRWTDEKIATEVKAARQ